MVISCDVLTSGHRDAEDRCQLASEHLALFVILNGGHPASVQNMLTPSFVSSISVFILFLLLPGKDIWSYNNNYIIVIFISTSFHLFSFLSHAPPSSGVSLA